MNWENKAKALSRKGLVVRVIYGLYGVGCSIDNLSGTTLIEVRGEDTAERAVSMALSTLKALTKARSAPEGA